MNAHGGSSPTHGSFGLELRDSASDVPPNISGIIQPGSLSFRQRDELVAAQQQYRQRNEDAMAALGVSNRPAPVGFPLSAWNRGSGWGSQQPPKMSQMPVANLYGSSARAATPRADAVSTQQNFERSDVNPFIRQMHPERPTVEQLTRYHEQSSAEDAFSTPSFVANRLCPWCGQFCSEDHLTLCDRRLVCCPVCDDLVFSKDAFQHLQKCQQNIIKLATERVEKRLLQIKQEREEELERQRVALLIQQAEADAAALREKANARVTTKQGLGSLLFSGISEADVVHEAAAAPAGARRQSVVQLVGSGGGDDPFSPSAGQPQAASPRRGSSFAAGPPSSEPEPGDGARIAAPVPSFRVPPTRQGSISVSAPATAPVRGASNVRPRGSAGVAADAAGDAGEEQPPLALQPSLLQSSASFSAGPTPPQGRTQQPSSGAPIPSSVNAQASGGGSGSDEPIPPGYKRCKWCSTPAPPEHEKKCASRIVMCKKCGSMIKMKDKDAHVKMCTAVNGNGSGGDAA
jgi:hypothetical protein